MILLPSMRGVLGAAAVAGVTWNPSDKGSDVTLSNGNRTFHGNTVVGTGSWARGTLAKSTGKWYFEVKVDVSGASVQAPQVGIQVGGVANGNNKIGLVSGYSIQTSSGFVWANGGATSTGVNYNTNDIIGVAVDFAAGKIWFAVNNTWVLSGNPAAGTNPAATGISGTYFPAISDGTTSPVGTYTGRFKTAHFTYTPPTGFTSWEGT